MGNIFFEVNVLLGKGSEFEGKFIFEGIVWIDGKFVGEIFFDDIFIIGEGVCVKVEINVGYVIVYGDVVGNIKVIESIELYELGCLKGNIMVFLFVVD